MVKPMQEMKRLLSAIAILCAFQSLGHAQTHLDLETLEQGKDTVTTDVAKTSPATEEAEGAAVKAPTKVKTINVEELSRMNQESRTAKTPQQVEIVPAPRREVSRPRMVTSADGDSWRTYQVDDMVVALNVRYHRNFGKYFRIDAYILNESGQDRFLNIDKASVQSDDGRTRLFTQDQYARKVQSNRFWTSVGIQAATFTTALILDEAIAGSWRGHGHGPGPRFGGPHPGYIAADAVMTTGSILTYAILAEYYDGRRGGVYDTSLNYMHNYNIRPDEAVQGFMYAQYSPSADRIIINLPIGGRIYSFEWLTNEVKRYAR